MKFRTKPTEVDAVMWKGDNLREVQRVAKTKFVLIPEDERPYTDDPDATAEVYDNRHGVWNLVLEGQWIVKERKRLLPLSDEDFQAKYEPVE